MFGSKDLLFTSEKYGVAKSLRFRSGSSTYFNRTFGTPTNNNVWTYSVWVKRGSVTASNSPLFAVYTDANNYTVLSFDGNQQLSFNIVTSGVARANSVTNNVFRDPSAWYHVLLVANRGEATDSNRIKMYINGSQVTSWSTTPTWDNSYSSLINANGNVHLIGNRSTSYFDGYLAEVNFIDGQALTASAFGFYDNNGIWQPKGYTGTYGTSGFYLKFTDVGATASPNNTGYGKDFSGFNTNYWTTNNFNSTSTSTSYDSMYDSPVNASNGITGIGNYCVINPLKRNVCTISNGNLTAAGPNGFTKSVVCSMSMPSGSGKYYWEAVFTRTSTSDGEVFVGIASTTWDPGQATGTPSVYPGNTSDSWGVTGNNGNKRNNGSSTAYGSAFASGDLIMVAYDAVNGSFYVGSNGTWFNSGAPASNTGYAYTGITTEVVPAFAVAYDVNSSIVNANFGQRPFAYSPPSGFVALNSLNLVAPTISNGAAYMAAVTYQGATAPNTVTTSSTNSGNNPLGISFQPDLVWIKAVFASTDNKLTDAVRGTTKALISNTTGAETTDTNGLTAFTTSGFTVGSDTTYNNTTGPVSYVAWEWKANGAGSTGSGSGLTSITNSANTAAGFSITTYTGNGSAGAYFNHGLGATPGLVIIKQRAGTNAGSNGWITWHSSFSSTQYVSLNLTDAVGTSTSVWNSTSPDSTKVTLGTSGSVNVSSGTYVAYCWAPISQFSSFGSFVGNNSTDGPYVYTGFRPRWVLMKNTTTAGTQWFLYDSSTSTYNVVGYEFAPNVTTYTPASYSRLDFLSNGFKIRASGIDSNISGNTMIYAAFAENPFKIARAR